MAAMDMQPVNYVDGFNKLCNNSKYVFYAAQLIMDLYSSSGQFCPATQIKSGIPISFAAIITQKDSPYATIFNKKLIYNLVFRTILYCSFLIVFCFYESLG